MLSTTMHAERPELPAAYTDLQHELREIATLASAAATLGWDQETMMPAAAAPLRAAQMALLAGLVHERRTSTRLGDLISTCEADAPLMADEREAANVRALRRDFDRATRLPVALVKDWAEATAMGMHLWRDARASNDFAAFAPSLQRLVQLNRDKAACFGAPEGGELYDALLEDYEPGSSAAELRRLFGALRADLVPLIREVAQAGRKPNTQWLSTSLPVERQAAFNRTVLERMGFDFGAGRLDTSAHPFCESMGPGDTRLTTRYAEDRVISALHASMHEAGHGLYEQGLPKAERFGQPLAEAASMGIHESQSRLWENFVGRGEPFWRWALPELREAAQSTVLDGVDVDTAFRAVNAIAPNLIRIESDEATYNLHIMLRFDLEVALLSGDLAVADLPTAWNDRIGSDLGVSVPDDARGCLQDVHWSMGAVAYFPTYTLGNLYAAQLWSAIRHAEPALDEQIAAGEFGALRGWLARNIYAHGRRYTAPELCERATGQRLSHEPLVAYLRDKTGRVYGI